MHGMNMIQKHVMRDTGCAVNPETHMRVTAPPVQLTPLQASWQGLVPLRQVDRMLLPLLNVAFMASSSSVSLAAAAAGGIASSSRAQVATTPSAR